MLPCSVFTLTMIGIITAAVYRLILPKYRAVFLCVISLAVYFLWAGLPALTVLLIQIVLGAISARMINRGSNPRFWLAAGISFTVISLAFFKYKDFFITDGSVLKRLIIPLGISYYSFKIISYLIDSFRNPNPAKNTADFIVYTSFFPQIICGPISRFDEISDYKAAKPNTEDLGLGLYLILKGLFYKTVISDRLSPYTAEVFGTYKGHGFVALWMAAFFFSVELYCDFAGYSYIVIGICRLMGLKIRDNFNLPYFSASIKEFWTRWHISLSSWLKDYIYIPLGGNRKGKVRRIVNVLMVFLISGLWHGNTPVYILWGLWHGIWNVLSPKTACKGIKRLPAVIGTYLIVMFGWITFKTENLTDLLGYIKGMFAFTRIDFAMLSDAVMPFYNDYSAVAKMLTAGILIVMLFAMELREHMGKSENKTARAVIYVTCIVLFGVFGTGGFIYANY